MKTYEEIKLECINDLKDKSKFKINLYILLIWLIYNVLITKLFIWIITFIVLNFLPIIFVLIGYWKLNVFFISFCSFSHLIYWYFEGEKGSTELLETMDENEYKTYIKVLKEIKTEMNTTK